MCAQAVPAIHSVQFYDDSKNLIDRLCGIIASTLKLRNSAVLVISLKHRVQLIKALADAEIDVRDAARAGRFVMCDANETLQQFMVDGMPDHERFRSIIAPLIDNARSAAAGPNQTVAVFGEMVANLLAQGNHRAMHALEALWNELLPGRGFQLHCAYPRYGFIKDPDHLHMMNICEAHTHLI
jgi:hypothetical protein